MKKTLAPMILGLFLLPSVAMGEAYLEAPGVIKSWHQDSAGAYKGGLTAQLTPHAGGEQAQYGYAGHEQATVTSFVDNLGNTHVVIAYMSSNVTGADTPVQVKASSIMLTPTGLPVLMNDQFYLTRNGNNQDRTGNHPHIEAFMLNGEWYLISSYGSDEANGNTQPYVGIRNALDLSEMAADRDYSQNNNNNVGAPQNRYAGLDGTGCAKIALTSYDNEARTTYARMARWCGPGTAIEFTTDQRAIVNPANIGRPTSTMLADGTLLICAARGDNRPPEDGIECSRRETTALNRYLDLPDELIMESNPGGDYYVNAPEIMNMGGNNFCVAAQESNGNGKNNNNKGSSSSLLRCYEATDTGFVMTAEYKNPGYNHVHLGGCVGMWGSSVGATAQAAPAMRMAIVDSGETDSGLSNVNFLRLDGTTIVMDDSRTTMAYRATGGHTANIYGGNPNTQGREFHQCLGNIVNPAYGSTAPDAFMPHVKSFFAFPEASRKTGEPKAAMMVRLMPGEVVGEDIQDDCTINPLECQPEADPGTDTDPNIDPDDGSGTPGTENWPEAPGKSPGLFGCSVSTGRSGGAFALLLLGFALFTLVTLRRR